MINKYVIYIDVDTDHGEVNIEGLENAPLIDYVSIGTEVLYQYEEQMREFLNSIKNV